MMEDHILNVMNTKFRKLENRLAKIEILLRKELAGEKKLHHEMKKIEKEEKEIGKAESLLEKDEKKLLKEVKNIEAEESWDTGMRFYCRFKIMDDHNVVVCNKIPGNKVCCYKYCPVK